MAATSREWNSLEALLKGGHANLCMHLMHAHMRLVNLPGRLSVLADVVRAVSCSCVPVRWRDQLQCVMNDLAFQ